MADELKCKLSIQPPKDKQGNELPHDLCSSKTQAEMRKLLGQFKELTVDEKAACFKEHSHFRYLELSETEFNEGLSLLCTAQKKTDRLIQIYLGLKEQQEGSEGAGQHGSPSKSP